LTFFGHFYPYDKKMKKILKIQTVQCFPTRKKSTSKSSFQIWEFFGQKITKNKENYKIYDLALKLFKWSFFITCTG